MSPQACFFCVERPLLSRGPSLALAWSPKNGVFRIGHINHPPPPCLERSFGGGGGKQKKDLCFFCIGQDIWCLPFAGF